MRPLNDFGTLFVLHADGKQEEIPTYTCGHCSGVVMMHKFRERPRNLCLSCRHWICESKEICNAQCTPLYAMADDHFENTGRHGVLVRGIMSGATTVQEAVSRALLLPNDAAKLS